MMRAAWVAGAVAVLVAGCAGPTEEPAGVTLEAVPLVNHIQFGVFEQDVYLLRDDALYRATPADAMDADAAAATLYAAGEEVAHDATFTHVGPFEPGVALPVTLGGWLAATGSAAYACVADQAHVAVTLQGGVPFGVYTVWNFWLEFEGGAIVGGADRPAGPADGSANTFTADALGGARFATMWDGCPDASTFDGADGRSWGVALAYHSDGRSHGPSPGQFGLNAHVQLFGLAVEGS